jgi:hypothetical protein
MVPKQSGFFAASGGIASLTWLFPDATERSVPALSACDYF